jgi:hypothetical protein
VERIFARFPSMIGDVMDIITQVLQQEREKARYIVEAVIDSEQNYLFTNDFDYLQNRTDIVPQADPQQVQPGQPGQPG